MHRLFVALRPPAPMRAALRAAMGGIGGARWQDDEQLHLTLRFIGDVDRHQAADIAAALGSVRHPRFELRLADVGAFEDRGRIEALWIGVSPQDSVKALHKSVDRALSRAGIAPDPRAFVPHITIARFSRGSAPAAPLPIGSITPAPIAATHDAFHLYESDLGASGSTYTIIERYPLVP